MQWVIQIRTNLFSSQSSLILYTTAELCAQNKNKAYPPKSHRIDEFPKLIIRCFEDVVNGAAMLLKASHGTWCHFILCLAWKHQWQQHLVSVCLKWTVNILRIRTEENLILFNQSIHWFTYYIILVKQIFPRLIFALITFMVDWT